jgi:sigma-B regulation protein RsbU (phosphoserine phosphatase)
MNGHRRTQIYTFSSNTPLFSMRSTLRPAGPRNHFAPEPAGFAQEAPQIQGLDYSGRRRAGEIGSDFFDFISRPAGILTVCMGAAPVPGAESALMVSGLENLLCSLSTEAETRPALIAEALNRSVCGAPGDDSYATLFYASVDPLRRQLSYVNAGHEPALLLRRRQNRVIILESTGAILGLTRRSSYGQRTIPLEPGDLLAVFSDSVAEAADILGHPFGPTGVLNVLRRSSNTHAADLVEEILDAAERHAGWGVPSTDQTVAVVRFTGDRAESISVETETARELAFAAA